MVSLLHTTLGLLAWSGTASVLAPLLLIRGDWRFRRPQLALGVWHGLLWTGLVALSGSFVLAMVAAAALVQRTVPGGGWGPVQGWLLLWAVAALLGASVVVVLRQGSRLAAAEACSVRGLDHLVLSRGVHQMVADQTAITVVDAERAVACALPGRLWSGGVRHHVLVSTALTSSLGAAELRSVVLHERAHLRRRHPLLLRVARLNAACLPMVPGARELERVSAMLVELIADDDAAREGDRLALVSALTTLGRREDDPAMLLRAERLRAAVRPAPSRPRLVPVLPAR